MLHKILLLFLYRTLSWTVRGNIDGVNVSLKKHPFSFNADPFFVREGSDIFLFYEEKFIWSKGTIKIRNIIKGNSLSLVEPFHLSFPFVFKFRNSWFMLPESSENNDLRFYVFDTNKLSINLYFSINCQKKYLDAVVCKVNPEKQRIDVILTEESKTGLFYLEICLLEKKILKTSQVNTFGYVYERNAGLIINHEGLSIVEQRSGLKGYGHYRVIHKLIKRNFNYELGTRRLMVNSACRNHHYFEINGSYVEDGMQY